MATSRKSSLSAPHRRPVSIRRRSSAENEYTVAHRPPSHRSRPSPDRARQHTPSESQASVVGLVGTTGSVRGCPGSVEVSTGVQVRPSSLLVIGVPPSTTAYTTPSDTVTSLTAGYCSQEVAVVANTAPAVAVHSRAVRPNPSGGRWGALRRSHAATGINATRATRSVGSRLVRPPSTGAASSATGASVFNATKPTVVTATANRQPPSTASATAISTTPATSLSLPVTTPPYRCFSR